MQIIPLGNKILCEAVEETKKERPSFRPETERDDKKKSERGRVVAIGDECKLKLKKGDIVYYQKFGPEYFKINDKEYACGIEDDFFVVLKDK